MSRKSDPFEKSDQMRKASLEWLKQNEPYYEKTIEYLTLVQGRKLFFIEILFISLCVSLLVNVISSNIYDVIYNKIELSTAIVSILILILIIEIIIIILKRETDKYAPMPRVLYLEFKDSDIKKFLDENKYTLIFDFIKDKKFNDFISFGEIVSKNLSSWFHFIFSPEIPLKPDKTSIEFLDESYKPRFPTHTATYNLSPYATTGVKIQLEIRIEPHVVFEISNIEGDLTSVRSFDVMFRFEIQNPTHPHSDNVVWALYNYSAPKMPECTAIAIERGFWNMIPELNPMKSRKNQLK